jgi:hypothetical protein
MNISLDNSVSSAMIKGETYNVLGYEEYRESQALWGLGSIAVAEKVGEDTYLLPYRGEYVEGKSTQPGIYSSGSLDFEVMPKESDEKNYKNIPIVTISSKDDIQTILEKENVLSKLAEPWITNPDNITQINIKDTDEPGMVCLKSAINSKHCDIDKYNQRFGQNFPNDKRQLKNSSVTLKIIDRYCENLDMEAILTIRDKEAGVPNPMKHPISVSLTTGEFLNMNFEDYGEESSDEDDF